MLKRGFLLGFIILLSSLYVSAYGFDIEVIPINTSIHFREGAVYNLTTKNNLEYENRYRIVVPDFALWSVQTIPQSHRLSGILLKPNSSMSTTLLIYPTDKIFPGRYQIRLVVNSEKTDEEIRKILNLNLLSGKYDQPEFKPELVVDVEMPNNGKIDPRKKVVIKVSLKNKNLLDIVDSSISLKSRLIDEQKTGISLTPLQKRSEEFTVIFDPSQEPISDTLTTTVSVLNKSFTVVKNYEIIGYIEPFQKEIRTEKGLFKTEQFIAITNPSNIESSEAYKIKTNIFKRLFVYTKPGAEVVKEDKLYLKWDIRLPAQDSIVIVVTTNYRPLFLILFLLLTGWVSYYILRSPLTIKKGVREIKRKNDGISELKLMLTIKNRGRKPISSIKVTDKLPNIIQVERESKIGMLSPSKITKHEKKGTIVTWDIDSLEEKEERIIIYRIVSKLSIIGKFILPPASIKFKDAKGKTIVVHSNLLSLK